MATLFTAQGNGSYEGQGTYFPVSWASDLALLSKTGTTFFPQKYVLYPMVQVGTRVEAVLRCVEC
jgi:hypothetical protein